MATPEKKAFAVLQFTKFESVVEIQRAFGEKFNYDSLNDSNIHRCHDQFETTGRLCKGQSTGPLRGSKENIEPIRECFLYSPKKFVWKADRELAGV